MVFSKGTASFTYSTSKPEFTFEGLPFFQAMRTHCVPFSGIASCFEVRDAFRVAFPVSRRIEPFRFTVFEDTTICVAFLSWYSFLKEGVAFTITEVPLIVFINISRDLPLLFALATDNFIPFATIS